MKYCNRRLVRGMVVLSVFIAFGILLHQTPKTETTDAISRRNRNIRSPAVVFGISICSYKTHEVEEVGITSQDKGKIQIPYLGLKIAKGVLAVFLPIVMSIMFAKIVVIAIWRVIHDEAISRSFTILEKDLGVEFQNYERDLSGQNYRTWTLPAWAMRDTGLLYSKIVYFVEAIVPIIMFVGPPVTLVYLLLSS